MPRIAADTVRDHIAAQERRIGEIAGELIPSVGFDRLTMQDVADRAGLARNSLYRYVPDKRHLVLLWFVGAVDDVSDALDAVSGADPHTIVVTWLIAQTRTFAQPSHRAMMAVASDVAATYDVLEREIRQRHEPLVAVLETALRDLLGSAPRHDSPEDTRRMLKVYIAVLNGIARSVGEQVNDGLSLEKAAEIVSDLLDPLLEQWKGHWNSQPA